MSCINLFDLFGFCSCFSTSTTTRISYCLTQKIRLIFCINHENFWKINRLIKSASCKEFSEAIRNWNFYRIIKLSLWKIKLDIQTLVWKSRGWEREREEGLTNIPITRYYTFQHNKSYYSRVEINLSFLQALDFVRLVLSALIISTLLSVFCYCSGVSNCSSTRNYCIDV